jgi:hypothetical protein
MARAKAAATCLLLALVVLFGTAPAWAESAWAESGKRYALVIGNSAYADVQPLPNTGRDAEAMAGALAALRFTVFKGIDLTHEQFKRLIGEFAAAAADADTVVFYFAGHGFQLSGLNHLAPVDAGLRDRARIDAETFVLNDIIERIHRQGRQTIVLLDACRNNPLPPGVQEGSSQGLAQLQTGDGIFIAFATQPGNVSYDGTGKNSPFTESLLTHIGKPGRSISDLMIEVRNDVSSRTLDRQVPWDQSSLRAQFYFNPSPDYIAMRQPAPGPGLVISPIRLGPDATGARTNAGEQASALRSQPLPEDAATDLAAPRPVRPNISFAPVAEQPAKEEPATADATAEPPAAAAPPATAAPVQRLQPAREYFVEDAPAEDAVAEDAPAEDAPAEDAVAEDAVAASEDAAGEEQQLAALAPQEMLPETRDEPRDRLIEPKELARRIQSDLARLGCYRLGVDGEWGPGSRTGLERYYREKDETAPSLEPSMEILLRLEGESGTICPPPKTPSPPKSRVASPPKEKAPAAAKAQRAEQRPAKPSPSSQPTAAPKAPKIIGF